MTRQNTSSAVTGDFLSYADPADEEWRGTKAQRAALRAKFGGKCAYCGCDLGKTMHADHRDPVIRITTDPWSNPLPRSEQRMIKPERNTVGNMMPACAPCNLHKGGYPLEAWRMYIQRSAEIVRKQTSTFRAGKRFVGIEKNERHFLTAVKRIKAAVAAIDAGLAKTAQAEDEAI